MWGVVSGGMDAGGMEWRDGYERVGSCGVDVRW